MHNSAHLIKAGGIKDILDMLCDDITFSPVHTIYMNPLHFHLTLQTSYTG